MGFLSKFVKVNGTVLVGGVSFTAYQYPELRKEPKQFLNAIQRSMRVGSTGIMMLSDYLRAEEITSETHKVAANRLYNCFCKNAGPYIKLGQMVHQLNNLIPKEYNHAFEPMCQRAPKTSYDDVRKVFFEETGLELEDYFEDFQKEPIASASLAQVHKAKLKATGEVVAVKV
jgi:aarF domain-containing kinase